MIDILQLVRQAGAIGGDTEAMVTQRNLLATLISMRRWDDMDMDRQRVFIMHRLLLICLGYYWHHLKTCQPRVQPPCSYDRYTFSLGLFILQGCWMICFRYPTQRLNFSHMRKQPPEAKGSSDSISVLHPDADRQVLCVAFSPILNGRGHRDTLTISPRTSF